MGENITQELFISDRKEKKPLETNYLKLNLR